jgi:hypothetical protein
MAAVFPGVHRGVCFRMDEGGTAMKTLFWILRHPLFAASWYVRGKPYSA